MTAVPPPPDPQTDRPPEPERPIEVFTAELLHRLHLAPEPSTALEAELGGPWHVHRTAAGEFGLYRAGDREYALEPIVRMTSRRVALLAAAALAGTARTTAYRADPEKRPTGYAIRRGKEEVGSASYFMADLCAALDVLEAVATSPSALACLLQAAGPTALERAGRELGLRLMIPEEKTEMTTTDTVDTETPEAMAEAASPPARPESPLRAVYARRLPPDLVRETVERLDKVLTDGLETYADWTDPDPVDLLGAFDAVATDLDASAAALREQEEHGAENEEAPLTIQAYAAGLLATQVEELARRVRAVAAWQPSPSQPYPPTAGPLPPAEATAEGART